MQEFGFEWPEDVSIQTAHLYCYRHHDEFNPNLLPKHVHLEKALRGIWPEKFSNGDTGYVWSEWSERRVHAWCYNEFMTWWGPAASAKSTDGAILALCDWLAAPDKTSVTLCSTSIEGLRQRIWREVVRFHSIAKMQDPGLFGAFRKQPPTLAYEPDDNDTAASTINAIFGIAMPEGSDENAMRNAFGKHNRYNILILDEMQMMHPAAMNAYDNTSAGGIINRFLGMGNPWSRLDGLGKASEPMGGWNSINPSMESWKTKRGICLYFDGLKSPGITDPKRYHFLVCQKDIDAMTIDPGVDSPRFWSQRRGFCPPEGMTETVLTNNFISKFDMTGKAIWLRKPKVIAGFDPAFSSGGDRACYVGADVGEERSGKTVLQVRPPEYINLSLADNGEPLTYNLANDVIDKLIRDGITPGDMSMDTTGAQRALADIIDILWRERVAKTPGLGTGTTNRISFGGAAAKEQFSLTDRSLSHDLFGNKVTELWMLFREYGMGGQIRGLDETAGLEFCSRLVLKKIFGGKVTVEPKVEMKTRTGGKSPDTADADVCVAHHVRYVMGIMPGGVAGAIAIKRFNDLERDLSLDYSDPTYTEEDSIGDALDIF